MPLLATHHFLYEQVGRWSLRDRDRRTGGRRVGAHAFPSSRLAKSGGERELRRRRFARSTRGGVAADRGGSVGAVDAVALAAEAEPAGAKRVRFSRRNDAALVVPGGIYDVIDDGEVAFRAGRHRRADGGGVDFEHAIVFENCQL